MVVTDIRQRAPVVAAVSVAVPRFSRPLVVATDTLMLLPVAIEVVPDRSQVNRLPLRICTVALLTWMSSISAAGLTATLTVAGATDSAPLASRAE
ncbi:hypothetical protein D3C81_1583720 [compost metagenome]